MKYYAEKAGATIMKAPEETAPSKYGTKATARDDSAQAGNRFISRERELVLIKRYQDDNSHKSSEAFRELYEAHKGYLINCVRKWKKGKGATFEYNVLLDEAVIGYAKAIENFDPAQEARLLTYAGWWIKDRLNRYIMRNSADIRPSLTVMALQGKIAALWDRFAMQAGRDPTIEELAAGLDETPENVQGALDKNVSTLSFDAPVKPEKDGGNSATVGDLIDSGENHASEIIERMSDRECLSTIFANCKLNDRERFILEQRYFPEDGRKRTLEEVAEDLADHLTEKPLTKERIRQLEARVLKKLYKTAQEKIGHDRNGDPLPTERPKPTEQQRGRPARPQPMVT